MNVYTFSLPEGCDLKLRTDWANVYLYVTYRGNEVLEMPAMILGEKISLRKTVRGTSFVVSSPDPVNNYDYVRRISRFVSTYGDEYAELNKNLSHLVGTPMGTAARNRMIETAQRTFDDTRERIRREQVIRELVHVGSYDQVWQDVSIPRAVTSITIPSLEIGGIPVVEDPSIPEGTVFATTPWITRGIVDFNDVRHVIQESGIFRMDSGASGQILANGDLTTVLGSS